MFLIQKNETRVKLHSLCYKSAEIQDQDDNKNQRKTDVKLADDHNAEDSGDTIKDEASANRAKKIDIKKISDTIVGLTSYESNITKDKVKKYLELVDSHKNESLSVHNFMFSLFLLLINLFGKYLKSDEKEVYKIMKITESLFRLHVDNYTSSNVSYFLPPAADTEFTRETEYALSQDYTVGLDGLPGMSKNITLNESIPERFRNAGIGDKTTIKARAANIKTKRELYDYLQYDFSQVAFTKGKYV